MENPNAENAPKASVEERLAAFLNPPEEAPSGDEPEQAEPKQVETEQSEIEQVDVEKAAKPDKADKPVADEDSEVIEIGTLHELAEHIGVEVGDLYNIRVPVTGSDGIKSEISLGEWKDAYQGTDKLTKAQKELAEQRDRWEAERQQAASRIEQSLKTAQSLTEAAERQLMQDIERIDWNGLRDADPAEYAARRQELLERQRLLEDAKARVSQEIQREHAERQTQSEAQWQEILRKEQKALQEALPEWRDEGKAKAEKAALSEYLQGAGFRSEEISNIADHRAVLLARKAMLYDKMVQQSDAAKKKVVKLGKKVLSPGVKQTRTEQKADALSKQRATLRKSGKVDDAAALIEALRGS